MLYLGNQYSYLDNLTTYLYGFDYVLSNGGMTLALQAQGHSIQLLK